MKTPAQPRCTAAPGHAARRAAHRAAVAATAAWLAAAGPAAANTRFADQSDTKVHIDAASALTFATGYSGGGVTGYAIEGAPPYLLLAGPGGNAAASPQLIATFVADPGRVFTRVEWTLAADVSTAEGSGVVQMAWGVGGVGSPASGARPTWSNPVWFWNATTTLASPAVPLDDGSFRLDLTANLRAAGRPGSCSTGDGLCARVGAPFVKVWVETAAATAVPEPGGGAQLLAGGGVLALLARRRTSPR